MTKVEKFIIQILREDYSVLYTLPGYVASHYTDPPGAEDEKIEDTDWSARAQSVDGTVKECLIKWGASPLQIDEIVTALNEFSISENKSTRDAVNDIRKRIDAITKLIGAGKEEDIDKELKKITNDISRIRHNERLWQMKRS